MGSLTSGEPSPLQLAMRLAQERPDNEAAQMLIVAATEPWSPATHELFPKAARARATELLLLIYCLCADPQQHRVWTSLTAWWWTRELLPLLVSREEAV